MLVYTIITLLHDFASSEKCKTLLIEVIQRNKILDGQLKEDMLSRRLSFIFDPQKWFTYVQCN